MKDSEFVMYLWNETEMRRKEKEDSKKLPENQKSDLRNEEKKGKEMMQNTKSDVGSEGKKRKEMTQNKKSDDSDRKIEKDKHGSVEKRVVDKEKQDEIKDVVEAGKLGTTTNNVDYNVGMVVSSEPKSVHESTDESAKEDVETTSYQENDIVQSPSQAKQ